MSSVSDLSSEPCLERHFTGHKEAITRVRFSPHGDLLATSSEDSTVIVWNLQQAARCIRFNAHDGPVRDIAWHPCTNLVASASNDRTVKLWQPLVSGIASDFLAHSSAVTTLDFNRSGSSLITGSQDKTIKLWSVPSKKFMSAFTAHTNYINGVRFCPANVDLIASCSDDRTIRIFDIRSGECTRTFNVDRANSSIPLSVAWHPTGALLGVSFSCGRIRIFDVNSNELIQLYHVHSEPVYDLSFHISGNYLLSSSGDGTMKLLDLLEGRPIFTLTGHTGPVMSSTFSNDGKKFASAGHDKQLLVWKSNLANSGLQRTNAPLAENDIGAEASSLSDESNNEIEPKLIDPRQSEEYTSIDENLQIEESDIDFAYMDGTLSLTGTGYLTDNEMTSSSKECSFHNDISTIKKKTTTNAATNTIEINKTANNGTTFSSNAFLNNTNEILTDMDFMLRDVMREVQNLRIDLQVVICRLDALERRN